MTRVLPAARARLMAMAAAVMLLVAPGEPAAEPTGATPVSEVTVRAAFLINVAKFVHWPDESGPLVIGVVAEDALVAALSQIAGGRTIGGRTLIVQAIAGTDAPTRCDVLYVGSLDERDTSALLARERKAVLTVGATTRFLRDGGIIRIFIDGDRMRFQVNRRRAEDAGLQISSQLLSLAVQ